MQQEGFSSGIQQGRQEGRQEGIQKGRQEGATQSLRETLTMQLSKRFGTPPSEAEQKQLLQASRAELRYWLEGIFAAQSIAELLSSQPPK